MWAITVLPASSFRVSPTRPKSSRGMGAPAAVPTPSTDKGNAAFTLSLTSPNVVTSSVIARIRPRCAPAFFIKRLAWMSASARLLPGSGMMAGCSCGNRFAMVRTSSVSGVTMWASPAYTTRAVRPSLRACNRSLMACCARIRRDGATSLAYIESDKSSRITSESLRSLTGCGSRCQLGPANATTASSQATPASHIGARLRCSV